MFFKENFYSNLGYLRLKLLIKENNKKLCDTFDHNSKNIPLYIITYVSFESIIWDINTVVPLLKKINHGAEPVLR